MRKAEKNTAVTAFQSNRFYTVVSAPAIAVLLLLFFVPLLIILSKGFISDEGKFTLGLITEALGDPYVLRVIAFTIIQSAVSTAGALAIGLPGAYLLSHYSFRGKRLVQAVANHSLHSPINPCSPRLCHILWKYRGAQYNPYEAVRSE